MKVVFVLALTLAFSAHARQGRPIGAAAPASGKIKGGAEVKTMVQGKAPKKLTRSYPSCEKSGPPCDAGGWVRCPGSTYYAEDVNLDGSYGCPLSN